MTKTYAVALPLLLLWLACWIVFSWGAIQDDALIHLRYADNLAAHHFITYDGVHANYGASSLLYVAILASLGKLIASPELPRAVSSIVHFALFAGLAYGFYYRLPKTAGVARLAGLVLLALLTMPSAVRWLDDGMETGIAVSLVCLMAWLIHGQAANAEAETKTPARGRYVAMAALAYLAVLLRTELALLCGFGCLILVRGEGQEARWKLASWRRLLRSSHLLVGGALALCTILGTMHVLLPDTAVAKSHGFSHWFNPIQDTAVTLGGAFSFGLGMVCFWVLTLALAALHRGRLTARTLLANLLLPVQLALASLRGQEIQGVRYFAWTLFFPAVWNILELAEPAGARTFPQIATGATARRGTLLLCVFAVLLALDAPFEIRTMFHVLTHRRETMHAFESQHLEVLKGRRGIASDIGYIGYFSGSQLCDLAGLVNGRTAARLTSGERDVACVQTQPDFLFGNASQLGSLSRIADFSGWQICGRYNFPNVRTLDSHYLVVRPPLVEEVCGATGQPPQPFHVLLASGR